MSYPHNINHAFALKRQNGEVIRTSSYSKPVTPDESEVQNDNDEQDVDDDNEDRDETEDEHEEFVIDKIITHRVNKNKKHKYAKLNRNLYRVRWYGYLPSADTWEPVEHLPRSKVLQYFKRMKLSVPHEVDDAVDG